MSKLFSPRFYSLFTGVVLFCFGFFGFAFKNSFDISAKYLIISLMLGFWGIVISVGRKTV